MAKPKARPPGFSLQVRPHATQRASGFPLQSLARLRMHTKLLLAKVSYALGCNKKMIFGKLAYLCTGFIGWMALKRSTTVA